MRELGWWLDENIDHKGGGLPQHHYIDVMVGKKPKFYLADIGVTPRQSYQWQDLAEFTGVYPRRAGV